MFLIDRAACKQLLLLLITIGYLTTSPDLHAQVITSGEIVIGDYDGDSLYDDLSVDTITFEVTGGTTVNFDALIFEGPLIGDLNADGEITAADGGMLLLDANGQLLVNHDDGPAGADGSFTGLDGNFTYTFSSGGTYVLAIGTGYRRNYAGGGYLLTPATALAGYITDYGTSLAFDQDHADWQVTLTSSGGTLSNVVARTLGVPATPNPVPNAPPEVACIVDKGTLWSPNHELIDVGLDAITSDDGTPDPLVDIFVFCNERDRDALGGDTCFDADALFLRSERNGNGSGRVYLIVIVATDADGASGFDCCTVVVPHDESEAAEGLVALEADLAELTCHESGAPPDGYLLLGSFRLP